MSAPMAGRPARPPARVRWARRATLAGVAGLATPWLVPWLPVGGVPAWLVDLASHWPWLYLPLVLLGLPFAARGRPVWLLALAALPLPWLAAAPRLPDVAAESVAAQDRLQVVVANVFVHNTDAAPLLRWLGEVQPDLVALLEISPGYEAAMGPLEAYPHRAMHARSLPEFGLGLLSRWPILASRVVPGPRGVPYLEAEVAVRGRPMRILVAHPMPPGTPRLHAERDAVLRQLAEQAAARGLPSLLAGDLNATPWCSAFAAVGAAGWRRAGTLQATWPSPGQGLFGIPIDHVLASPGWRAVGHAVGPAIGSDHRPVRFELAMPR